MYFNIYLMHAAHYLNPRYQYKDNTGNDGELIRAVHNVYQKLDPDSPHVAQFGNEVKLLAITLYKVSLSHSPNCVKY